jgi:hypothetical protein
VDSGCASTLDYVTVCEPTHSEVRSTIGETKVGGIKCAKKKKKNLETREEWVAPRPPPPKHNKGNSTRLSCGMKN